MGQVFIPAASSGFPSIVPIDRLSARNAGTGQSGNHVFFVMQDAGQNSTISEFIALGNGAGAGGVAGVEYTGLVAIGSGAFGALSTVPLVPTVATNVGLGYHVAQNLVFGMANVFIGDRVCRVAIGANNGTMNRNVGIGAFAFENFAADGGAYFSQDNVCIGYRAGRLTTDGGAGNRGSISNSVFIGSQAGGSLADGAAGHGVNNSVIVGFQAGLVLGANAVNTNDNVLIGASCGKALTSGAENTLIGANALETGTTCQRNAALGAAIKNQVSAASSSKNVLLGYGVDIRGAVGVNDCNVVIGYRANSAGVTLTSAFLLEIADEQSSAGAAKALAFGKFDTGNLVLGNSTNGVNRDLPGTNILKLLNGTTTGAPVGGGYFYVVAGALHWVGSAGTDTVVAPA